MSLALLSAGGSILSGLFGSSSAKKAAAAQTEAANRQIDLQQGIYDDQKVLFDPYYQGGLQAQNALAFEMGLGPRPTFGGSPLEVTEFTDTIQGGTSRQTEQDRRRLMSNADGSDKDQYRIGAWQPQITNVGSSEVTKYRVGDQVFGDRAAADEYAQANPTGAQEYGGFTKTPGYDFRLQQGQDQINASAAAGGNFFSGATLKAGAEYGQNFASNEYGNYLNGLRSMASGGQAAAGQSAAAGQNFAAGASNALGSIGNAQAANATAQANIFNNTLGNLAGIGQYQATKNDTGNVFSGSFWK